MEIDWDRLTAGEAAGLDGCEVALAGWLLPLGEEADVATSFALLEEPPCCGVCLPRDPRRRVEVLTAQPLAPPAAAVVLAGRFHILKDDDAGWLYRLAEARLVSPPAALGPTRRGVLAAGALLGLATCSNPITSSAVAEAAEDTPVAVSLDEARAVLAEAATVDIHSHAGSIIGVKRVREAAPFSPLAEPMRAGGLAVACLAAVSDSPTHHVTADRRIRPFRDPEPGELYLYAELGFRRIHELAKEQDLGIVATAADLAAARAGRPSIVVAVEGGDFLEGLPDRVDEAYERWQLRHLQLTHYRVNELGDIQTEAPVHDGLSEAGAAVIRRCNRRGLVVDVAHGTLELVKRAAEVTEKPLVLSHTSLAAQPRPRSRLISPEHARIVAGTGGVIGIWPPTAFFADMTALADGIARMVDAVGVEHVGIGSDMLGLVGPSVLPSYRELPALAAALLARGFGREELLLLMGGNYARVFAVSLA